MPRPEVEVPIVFRKAIDRLSDTTTTYPAETNDIEI